jgi:hypothetical protein
VGEELHSLQAYLLDVARAPWVEGNGCTNPPADLVIEHHLEDCEVKAVSLGCLTH